MSSKSKLNSDKSTLSETPNSKASLATPDKKASPGTTPRISKLSRGVTKCESDSPSPLQASRLSVDRSSRPVASKPSLDRRSTKPSTTSDKQPTRVSKGSELQAQLNLVQDDLKKANEKLLLVEKEKAEAVDELKEAQRVAEEANAKLTEALVAQKRAEEDSEIEKFRAVEMEQASIEATQKKEEEWQKEIEDMKSKHALDISALLIATQELEKVKQELAMSCDAKSQALSHADDATKIAEIHVEKVETLSAELVRLKAMLDSKIKTEANDTNRIILELSTEVEMLKQDLEKAKAYETEAYKNNATVLELNAEVEMLKQELEKSKVYETEAKKCGEMVLELNEEVETLKHDFEKAKGHEMEAEKYSKLVLELKSEVDKLKQELEKAKDYETEAEKYGEMVLELRSEVEMLKQELEKAEDLEERLAENESSLEQLNVELEAAKMAESYAHNVAEEWKKKVKELEVHSQQANRLERSASESLESIMKQLEGSNDMLNDAESEISSLKEKVGLLEMSIGSQRGDLELSKEKLIAANKEASEMAKQVEILKAELDIVKDEKAQALNNEKLAADSVQTLLEEKNKLITELETLKVEEEKSKKAMESLASALHEVSSEAREAKEKLLYSQDEHENYETQIENLKLVLKASNEKYEGLLDDAKHEIEILTNLVEQSKLNHRTTKEEWEQKEIHLRDCVNKAEEDNSSIAKEVSRLVKSLQDAAEEEAHLRSTLKETESEVKYLKEIIGETKAESMKLKECLIDKENELHSIIQENEELRTKESSSVKKVDDLSKLLEEAVARNQAEENNGELTDSEKDYDMLPKVVEFSERNGGHKEEIPLEDSKVLQVGGPTENGTRIWDINGEAIGSENKEKEDYDSVENEFKMWESCKIEEKEFSAEKESVDEVESNAEGNENVENGGKSPTKEQSQKKKKALLGKFGSLLKKKGSSKQK